MPRDSLVALSRLVVATLASYISRVYSEFGKILSREVQENLDAWEERIEPQLGLSREHAALSAAVLQAACAGRHRARVRRVLFDRARTRAGRTLVEIAQAVLGVVLVVVFCKPAIPSLLFNRTRGLWAARLLWPIRLLLWLVTPVTVFIRFFFSVAALAEEPAGPEEEPARRRGGADRSRRRRGNSGAERPRTGALRRRVRRQAGARGDDAAAGDLRRPRIDHARAAFWSCCASTTTRACRSIPARSTT